MRTGFSAVPPSWGSRPVRPVTLRSPSFEGFAFVKIASELTGQIRSFYNLLTSIDHRLHVAGRKSIGYTIVTACTPSFAPKLIVLTRLTT